MEQDIRYCELDGRRIAYATVGEISDAFRKIHGEYREALVF